MGRLRVAVFGGVALTSSAGETVRLPASTVQVLEGVVEMDGDVYAAGSIIPLEAEARARAIGAATLLVTRPR